MDAIIDVVGGLFEAIANAVKFAFAAVGIFSLIIVSTLATAFVARDYWNWFVAPLGLPHIGLLHAFGLIAFVGLLRTDYSKRPLSNDGREDDEVLGTAVGAILGLALSWGVGWLIVTLGGPF